MRMAMGSVTRTKKAELQEALSHLIGLKNRKADHLYSINVTLSDETSLDRDLPDTRPPVCATLPYDTFNLPKCTIIIPFFNEAPTMILRALHSVLSRSPAHLLEEIILGLRTVSMLPFNVYIVDTITYGLRVLFFDHIVNALQAQNMQNVHRRRFKTCVLVGPYTDRPT